MAEENEDRIEFVLVRNEEKYCKRKGDEEL